MSPEEGDSPLRLKLKPLGADDDDLESLIQAIKRRVSVAAHDDVIRGADTGGDVRILLTGTTCACTRTQGGARSILSFQHPGDFCDLGPYIVPDLRSAVGIQALTNCVVGIVDRRDLDRLLSRSTLATAFWRASMLEAAVYRERSAGTDRRTELQRVAHLLCEQLARREAVNIQSPRLPFSQIDLADASALPVAHVDDAIRTLRDLNVLSKASHVIDVLDREQLGKIAGFDGRYLDMPRLVSNWTVQIEEADRLE